MRCFWRCTTRSKLEEPASPHYSPPSRPEVSLGKLYYLLFPCLRVFVLLFIHTNEEMVDHNSYSWIFHRYTIREQVLDDGIVSELSILQTYRQDTGALTCRASNAYGQDEMLIHLVIQEVPEMPKNIRIIDQQSRTIQISWTQPYAGNSPIINYIVQFKEASGTP